MSETRDERRGNLGWPRGALHERAQCSRCDQVAVPRTQSTVPKCTGVRMDQSCSSPTRSASVVSPRLCFALWTAADCSVHTSTHARAQPLHFQRHHPCTLRLALATPRPRSQGQRPHQVRPTLCFSQSSVDRLTCRQHKEWPEKTPPPSPRRRPPPPPRTRPASPPTQAAAPLAVAVPRPPPPETATPTTPAKSPRVSSVGPGTGTGTGRTSPRLRAHSLAGPPLRDKTATRLCLARGDRKTWTRTPTWTGKRTTSRTGGMSSACRSASTLVSCARPPRSTRPRSHSRLSSTARRSTSEADARATTRPTRRRTSPAQPRACASPRARLSALAQR